MSPNQSVYISGIFGHFHEMSPRNKQARLTRRFISLVQLRVPGTRR
jgi:hypothetical protein